MLEKLIEVQNILENIDLNIQNNPEFAKDNENGNSQEWGVLINIEKEQKICSLKGTSFTIGRNKKCNLCISDSMVPSFLAKITFNSSSDFVFIEQRSRRISLLLNSQPMILGEKKSLQDQDILTIVAGIKKFSFVKKKKKILISFDNFDHRPFFFFFFQRFERIKTGNRLLTQNERNSETSSEREISLFPINLKPLESRKRKVPQLGESLDKIFLVSERTPNHDTSNERPENLLLEDISNLNEKNHHQDQFSLDDNLLYDVLEDDKEKFDNESIRSNCKEELKKIILDPNQIEDDLESFPYYIEYKNFFFFLFLVF